MMELIEIKKIKNLFADWIFPDIGDTVMYKKASVKSWIKDERKTCGLYCRNGSNIEGKFQVEYQNATFDTISKFGKLNESEIMWWTPDKYTKLILTEKRLKFHSDD